MKTLASLFILFFALSINFSNAQSIPYGTSYDSITVHYAYDDIKYYTYYYKPTNYDSINSPVLFAIHGQGGNGASAIGDLQAIADRRNALIIAPNMPYGWEYGYIRIIHNDSTPHCRNLYWLTDFMKQIYFRVLNKENRVVIPSYLIGFSAGGQFVTRYMLIRQDHLDSIPIKMAVSSNPFYYTFCIRDSLNGAWMYYECGLAGDSIINYSGNCYPNDGVSDTIKLGFSCNEHITQYYNENYAVLIGTADNAIIGPFISCIVAQGSNRYERAQNFYHFSDSDAVARGTTLKWQYGEVPGVGHNMNLMYNTILSGDSMPLAERLLFETPYHTVPNLAPHANFTVDTTFVSLPSATVQFYNLSQNCDFYLWDFGDGTTNDTDIEPQHTYTYADTFSVKLIGYSPGGCENEIIKKDFVVVAPVGIHEYNSPFNFLTISPNPANNECFINFKTNEKDFTIQVLNCMGQVVNVSQNNSVYANNKVTVKLNTQTLSAGIYFIKINGNTGIAVSRMIKE